MFFTISSDYNNYNYSRRNNKIKSDILNDIGKADGFIYWCDQSALYFGSDRNNPVKCRPVVIISKHNNSFYVAPCTSKSVHNNNKSHFFPLTEKTTMWKKSNNKISYCYEVISNVSIANLGEKLGVMDQNSRVELFKWLKDRQ